MLKIKTFVSFCAHVFYDDSTGFDFALPIDNGETECYSQDLSPFNGLYAYDHFDGGDRLLDITEPGKLQTSPRFDGGSVDTSLLCYGYGPGHISIEGECHTC